MENKKGSGIFLGVIGVATLIVAIIGATFAFFSAQANSAEQAITATGAVLQLAFTEDNSGLNQHLIPSADNLAEFAAFDPTHIGENRANECLDDNKNEICGVYNFTIGNPSFTTKQDLYGKIVVANNSFTNLVFQLYDETETPLLTGAKNFNDNEEMVIDLGWLAALAPSSLDDTNGDGTADTRDDGTTFDPTKPETFKKVCTYNGTDCKETNVRNYKLVMWIHEIGSDQTEMDSNGATMAAGVVLTSASDTEGVTGVISAAKDYDSKTPSAPSKPAA